MIEHLQVSAEEDPLIVAARRAAANAYAPYSRFAVGAVVETDRGRFAGCNVENASYGLTVCAERVALFAAISAGATRFDRLAVSCIGDRSKEADSLSESANGALPPEARMPCGACRQVMAEFMKPDAPVLIDGAGAWSVRDLLPSAFVLRSG